MSEPSSGDEEEYLGGPPPLLPDSHPESDPIEEIPEADLDLDVLMPALIEPQDSAPLPAREIVPLRAFTARSTSSVGSHARIGEFTTVPHRLYTEVVRECHFLHGQNHELRRMNDQKALEEPTGFGEKARALADVISRQMEMGASTSEGDRNAVELAQLLQWVTQELQFLGKM